MWDLIYATINGLDQEGCECGATLREKDKFSPFIMKPGEGTPTITLNSHFLVWAQMWLGPS